MKTHLVRTGAGAVFALALTAAAFAQAHQAAPGHAQGEASVQAPDSTVSLQGDGGKSWAAAPQMHRFYDATVAAFASGPDKVDVAAYETASRAIFDDFARANGMDPKGMQDHLKLVPGQMVKIAREDPKVLQSYEAFTVAMMGPQ